MLARHWHRVSATTSEQPKAPLLCQMVPMIKTNDMCCKAHGAPFNVVWCLRSCMCVYRLFNMYARRCNRVSISTPHACTTRASALTSSHASRQRQRYALMKRPSRLVAGRSSGFALHLALCWLRWFSSRELHTAHAHQMCDRSRIVQTGTCLKSNIWRRISHSHFRIQSNTTRVVNRMLPHLKTHPVLNLATSRRHAPKAGPHLRHHPECFVQYIHALTNHTRVTPPNLYTDELPLLQYYYNVPPERLVFTNTMFVMCTYKTLRLAKRTRHVTHRT